MIKEDESSMTCSDVATLTIFNQGEYNFSTVPFYGIDSDGAPMVELKTRERHLPHLLSPESVVATPVS